MQEKVFRIIKSSPNISKAEVARLCGVTETGVRYHIRNLKKENGLHWEGHSLNGRWVWEEDV
jgi:predicted HTH transcriptional regulator